MNRQPNRAKIPCVRCLFCVFVLLFSFASATHAATEITGSVRNQTRALPAVGDEVILFLLDPKMHVEARTKTSDQGTFAFPSPDLDTPYMLRVVHQGVAYDHRARAGDSLSIQVFDAATRVPGVTGTIEILRAGIVEKHLHVSDMYELQNHSSPPLTQASSRTFEVYLPANAKLDSVLAAGPGKIGVIISAIPVPGEKGHYAVDFPLRPGATKFAFNYDLPYEGHARFSTRRAYAVQQFAVMIPLAMKFSSRSPAFQLLPAANANYRVFAINQLRVGKGPAFEIFGIGELPALSARAPAKLQTPVPYPSRLSAPPSASSPRPASPGNLSPSHSQIPVATGLFALLLLTCVFLIWRTRKMRNLPAANANAKVLAPRPPLPQRTALLLEAVRLELSRLEADQLRGFISVDDYKSTRLALEKTCQRALGK